ncbi:hypothetical protein RA276_28070, partial [Pseudomonas syringae pv. tagetis]|uniref:hypothetical protein n=1 Tax=Pseudomonas syringae group genomosp. 7 TaxID=251699 RepID=UPI0037704228
MVVLVGFGWFLCGCGVLCGGVVCWGDGWVCGGGWSGWGVWVGGPGADCVGWCGCGWVGLCCFGVWLVFGGVLYWCCGCIGGFGVGVWDLGCLGLHGDCWCVLDWGEDLA